MKNDEKYYFRHDGQRRPLRGGTYLNSDQNKSGDQKKVVGSELGKIGRGHIKHNFVSHGEEFFISL